MARMRPDQYQVDEQHRNDIRNEVARDALVKQAMLHRAAQEEANSSKTSMAIRRIVEPVRREFNILRRRWVYLLKAIGLLALVVGLVLPQVTTHAGGPTKEENSAGAPDQAYVEFRLGSFYIVRGEWDKAIEHFSQAIALDPTYGNAYAARGDCLTTVGKYDAAIADFSQALVIEPEYLSVYVARGRAYHAKWQLDTARADYERALSISSTYAPAYWALGDMYYDLGQQDEALGNYVQYLKLAEGSPDQGFISRMAPLSARATAIVTYALISIG